MSGWRHGVECDDHGPSHCGFDGGCRCTTPTPDPASPCGTCGRPPDMDRCSPGSLTNPSHHTAALGCHKPTPTRCTCGHPIEPTPGGTR